MSRHASRTDSVMLQYKRRVPSDVAERLRGRTVTVTLPATGNVAEEVVSFKLGEVAKVSLRTRDGSVADVRALHVAAHLAKVYEGARSGPVALSQRQIVALSGEVYHLLINEHEENPGTEAEWSRFKALVRAAVEGRITGAPAIPLRGRCDDAVMAEVLFGRDGNLTHAVDALPRSEDTRALEQRVGRLAVWVLGRHGIEVDPATHLNLLREIARAALQFGWQAKRMAAGDYRPDPDANRFPSFETKPKSAGLTLSGLFERWRAETGPAAGTMSSWNGVVRSLIKEMGQDEAVSRISKADILAWKDARVAAGVKGSTVNVQLMALRALLNHGVRNGVLKENVATGVRVLAKERAGEGRLAYSNADIASLLDHAARETKPHLRWLPLLLIATGARVGEIAQAWAPQVRQVGTIWVLDIRPAPDGGSIKNASSERTVPLHPVVIEAGFLDYVRERGQGPLFYLKPKRGEGRMHPSKGVCNKIGTWIRSRPGFDNARIDPAHGIRHWWKSAAVRAGVADSVADHLQGHAAASVAGRYRHFEIETLAQAVAQIPIPGQGVVVDRDSAMPVTATV